MSTSSCLNGYLYHVHHFHGVTLWYAGYDGRGTIILCQDPLWAVEVTPSETDVVWDALIRAYPPGTFKAGCLVPCDNHELTADQRKILNLAD